jgi:hypothetical protein
MVTLRQALLVMRGKLLGGLGLFLLMAPSFCGFYHFPFGDTVWLKN